MAKTKGVVLLFEDDDSIAADFRKQIHRRLGPNLELEVFPLDRQPEDRTSPYEDRVYDMIEAGDYRKDLVLVVTDRDLSAHSDHWRGLSQAAVSAACRRLGVPVACYRRKKTNVVDEFKRIPGDGLIELPDEMLARIKYCVILARGFQQLSAEINASKRNTSKHAVGITSPGVLLANVLRQPLAAAHLDTFACGDQLAIAEILNAGESRLSTGVQKRLITALGVWLADLVMKYPGVLVSVNAAASYLDIHPHSFMRDDVQRLFSSARYRDLPFADDEAPVWWRHLLDEILSKNNCSTGLELCAKKDIQRVRYCPCSINPKLHAGFLDMATNEPISAANSSGRVKWFPPGADLARLNKSTYRKLAPWIGT